MVTIINQPFGKKERMMGVGVSLQTWAPKHNNKVDLQDKDYEPMIVIYPHSYLPNLFGLLREGCSQSQALQIINTM